MEKHQSLTQTLKKYKADNDTSLSGTVGGGTEEDDPTRKRVLENLNAMPVLPPTHSRFQQLEDGSKNLITMSVRPLLIAALAIRTHAHAHAQAEDHLKRIREEAAVTVLTGGEGKDSWVEAEAEVSGTARCGVHELIWTPTRVRRHTQGWREYGVHSIPARQDKHRHPASEGRYDDATRRPPYL